MHKKSMMIMNLKVVYVDDQRLLTGRNCVLLRVTITKS